MSEKSPTLPGVAVVVLNWNNFAATDRCLRSLQGLSYPNHSICLVDNGSTDGSFEKLQSKFEGSGILIVANQQNLGFAAGCNQGIRKVLDEGCDYVLLLNNDCIVPDPAFLAAALEVAESNPDVGIVGGKILFYPATDTILSTGGRILPWFNEIHYGYGEQDRGQYDQLAERAFISGALMLIRRSVFRDVGLLPEAYFFGKEEWEFSLRCRQAGYRLMYCPQFVVYHEAGDSHEPADPTYAYNWALAKILYRRRNTSAWKFTVWFYLYRIYVSVLFPARYRLQSNRYLQALPPESIRFALRAAVRDGAAIEKITESTLKSFRAKFESR